MFIVHFSVFFLARQTQCAAGAEAFVALLCRAVPGTEPLAPASNRTSKRKETAEEKQPEGGGVCLCLCYRKDRSLCCLLGFLCLFCIVCICQLQQQQSVHCFPNATVCVCEWRTNSVSQTVRQPH